MAPPTLIESRHPGFTSLPMSILFMPSDADRFEDDFEAMKEFVDDEGNHYSVIQFADDSGRVFRRRPSLDDTSIAEFVQHDLSAIGCMRNIAVATDFEVDEDTNTQRNLVELMSE